MFPGCVKIGGLGSMQEWISYFLHLLTPGWKGVVGVSVDLLGLVVDFMREKEIPTDLVLKGVWGD